MIRVNNSIGLVKLSGSKSGYVSTPCTVQPLYNTPRYNTDLDTNKSIFALIFTKNYGQF